MAQKTPKPPAKLRTAGRALWLAVMTDYTLEAHESSLLLQACRTADTLDDLQAQLEKDGVMSESSQGPRVHPALVEMRQQRIALARLVAALRIPQGEAGAGRPQGRGGPRGVYAIDGQAS